mgnify:CR=1 FL=1|tara:strand:+ start:915 stop:1343 length:429 start_codon:yes stop_codon:yes gene_type:complete
MHNIFNQFSIFQSPTFAKSLHFKITKSPYEMATRDTKSKSPKKGNYQAPTAGMFPNEMPNFQAEASKVSKAFLPLKGNNNFSKQFSSKIKSRSTDNAKEGFGKSKEKITSLASNSDFGEAKPFKRLHYINTSNIHRLQVHLN